MEYPVKVRISVLESMPSGNLSIEDIAASLNVSKRTFQRKLKAESTNFLEQVSIIREERARYYLVKTDLSCDEISILLGYEQPYSFTRAFTKWTGINPGSLRN